jgi:hypothetical protein
MVGAGLVLAIAAVHRSASAAAAFQPLWSADSTGQLNRAVQQLLANDPTEAVRRHLEAADLCIRMSLDTGGSVNLAKQEIGRYLDKVNRSAQRCTWLAAALVVIGCGALVCTRRTRAREPGSAAPTGLELATSALATSAAVLCKADGTIAWASPKLLATTDLEAGLVLGLKLPILARVLTGGHAFDGLPRERDRRGDGSVSVAYRSSEARWQWRVEPLQLNGEQMNAAYLEPSTPPPPDPQEELMRLLADRVQVAYNELEELHNAEQVLDAANQVVAASGAISELYLTMERLRAANQALATKLKRLEKGKVTTLPIDDDLVDRITSLLDLLGDKRLKEISSTHFRLQEAQEAVEELFQAIKSIGSAE